MLLNKKKLHCVNRLSKSMINRFELCVEVGGEHIEQIIRV